MNIRDYMRQLNESTSFSKKEVVDQQKRNSCEQAEKNIPDEWENIGSAPPSLDTFSLELQQLKKEFALAATQMIINHPRIIDMPTATDEAVELKRRGEYVKSSRFYADYMRDSNILTPMMAMAWFKCLAAGGDTQDALILADYLYANNPPECYATGMLKQHVQTLKQLIDRRDKRQLLQFLGQLSGNPQYSMAITDIDVFADEINQETNGSEKSDEYGVAVRHHQRDIEESLLRREAIHRVIDGQDCIITPAYQCYLSIDPCSQRDFFAVGARMELDSLKVHLCIGPDLTTGRMSMFWVGPFGRLDNTDVEPALYYYLQKAIPDAKEWLIKYISSNR